MCKVNQGGTPFISKSFALATVYKGKPWWFGGLRTRHRTDFTETSSHMCIQLRTCKGNFQKRPLYLTSCVQDLAFIITHHKVIDIFLKISRSIQRRKSKNSSEDAQVFQNPDSQETQGLLSKVILAPCVLHFPFPIFRSS